MRPSLKYAQTKRKKKYISNMYIIIIIYYIWFFMKYTIVVYIFIYLFYRQAAVFSQWRRDLLKALYGLHRYYEYPKIL